MADASWPTSKTDLSCREIFSALKVKSCWEYFRIPSDILAQIWPVLPLHFGDESQLVVPSQNHIVDYFLSHSLYSTLNRIISCRDKLWFTGCEHIFTLKLHCVRSGLLRKHLVNSYRHGYHKMTSSYWSWYPEPTQWGTLAFTKILIQRGRR